MAQILEGTWEELARHAPELLGKRLRLTVLDDPADNVGPRRQYLTFGMFPQDRDLSEEEFRLAEFHGDADDLLDWQ